MSANKAAYNPQEIEPRVQKYWEDHQTFQAKESRKILLLGNVPISFRTSAYGART